MALKAYFDKQDEIPEELRTFYAEQNGRWVLDVEPVGEFKLSDGSSLKAALQNERQQRTQLEQNLAKFEGLDPAEARTAVEKLSEMGKDPKLKVDELVDAKVKTIAEQHKQALEERDKRINSLSGQLKTIKLDNRSLQKITELGGNPKVLMPAVREQIMWSGEDGTDPVVPDPSNPNQHRWYVGDDNNPVPMGPEHLIEEMSKSDDWAPAFRASGASGSGATGGQGVKQSAGGVKTISASDHHALSSNLEGIARGDVQVVQD